MMTVLIIDTVERYGNIDVERVDPRGLRVVGVARAPRGFVHGVELLEDLLVIGLALRHLCDVSVEGLLDIQP